MMTCLLLKLENPILWKGCLDEVDVWQLAIISPDTPANQHNISLTLLSAQTTFFQDDYQRKMHTLEELQQ